MYTLLMSARKFPGVTTDSPAFADSLRYVAGLELAEIAVMAGCDCPPRRSAGATFLQLVRDRTIEGVRATIDRGRAPRVAISTTNARLVATVPDRYSAHPQQIWAAVSDLSGWQVPVPKSASSDIPRPPHSTRDATGIAAATLKTIARTLANAVVDQLEAAYSRIVSSKIACLYQTELYALREQGYPADVILNRN